MMQETTKLAFAELWLNLGCERDPSSVYQDLVDAYSSERRKYHTLTHVGWALRRVNEMAEDDKTRGAKHVKREWDLIRFAVWYHDYFLDGSPLDEERSGDAAYDALSVTGGVPDGHEAKRLVLATGHDRVPLRYDEAIICDADLSILGSDLDSFDQYEKLVREEWAHVPDLLFATARTTILKRFADKPWIYMTDYGRTRWERKARSNLARSMWALAEMANSR